MNSPILASNVFPYRQPSSWRATQEKKQVRLDPHTGLDFHQLMESVWKNSVDSMRVTDSEGMIVAVNDAYCRFVGMQPGDLIGKTFTIVYDRSTDPARLVEKYCRRFKEKSVEPLMDRQIRLWNGMEANVETSTSYLEGSAGETFLLNVFRDITERRQLEQALDRERGLLRTIIDNLPDRIFAKDTESRFILNNDAHVHALGAQSQSEVVGKTDFDFRPRNLAEDMFIDDQEVIRSGKRILEKEEQTIDPSGKSVYRLVTKVPMRDEQGTVVGLVGLSRDVTERKRMAEQIRERMKELQAFYRMSEMTEREGITLDKLYQELANILPISWLHAEAACARIVIGDSEFRTKNFTESKWMQSAPVKVSETVVGRIDVGYLEERPEQDEGPFLKEERRLIDAIAERLGHITARKRAEDALSESERKYHELFTNAVQGIFQSSVDGKLLSANPALLKMLGYNSFEELAAKNLADVYVNPDERHALSIMLVEKGACSNVELMLKRKDGVVINALEHSRAVKDAAGNVTEFEGTLEDITERRALEARVQEHVAALKTSQESLSELNAQKDRLFSILSHDLRSPFTSILGFCGILLDEGESLSAAERKEFLGHIQNSAERQMALLNKLLDWSRLETGRIKLDVRDVDLALVVAHSVRSHLGIAKKKEITLQSTLPTQIKTRGDEVMIGQVFSNLISNALKFTPAHGLISIDLVESKEDQWILAVKDTGAGIPKEDFGKLFKIEEKYTRKGLEGEEGTGLGLSVVHEIVKKHSGSITIESEVGKGTTFFIHFPRLMENIERSVLVVDDDEGVRVLHSRFLKRMFPDSRIIQASDGKEAFELAKRYRPQIIVTDYSMPEMNGFEFLKLLRQEAGTKEIPVFVITGKDSTASREAMRLSGAAAVLTKPVSSAQLQEAIDKVMADRV